MGKRSDFERLPRDAYDTPREAVAPLLPHLLYGEMFVEPCAGDGSLVRLLESAGLSCQYAADIEPRGKGIERQDALDGGLWAFCPHSVDYIITNPPWTRETLHAMIVAFSDLAPTWLLFDADWAHTRQAIPYMPRLRKIVSVGRVKWIPGSKMTGKDNCAWHLFTRPEAQPATFHMRAA